MQSVGDILKNRYPLLQERSSLLNVSELESKGFFKYPNLLFDSIIFNKSLSKRQIKILLLIVRFSIGCNRTVARLKPSDFALVGIYSSDISSELNHLVNGKLIIWKREKNLMWITRKLVSDSLHSSNKEISKLLTRNLAKHSEYTKQFTNKGVAEITNGTSQTDNRNTVKNIYKYNS